MSRESTVEYEVSHDTASLALTDILYDCSDRAGDCDYCKAKRMCEGVYNVFTGEVGLRKIRLTNKFVLKGDDGKQVVGGCPRCGTKALLYGVAGHKYCESCALKQRSYEALMQTARYRYRKSPFYSIFKNRIELVIIGAEQLSFGGMR